MRATARIVAVADPRGGTRLPVLQGQAPLLPRRTGPRGAGGEAQVHLVGGAAGPLGGDDLRIEVEVAAGARLCVRTVAAALTLPGPAGFRSRLVVHATVQPGGSLRWLPEPVIAAAGCDHEAVAVVQVAAGGSLVWRDELVCGRHGEAPGRFRQETTIRYAGSTLYRQDLTVGPGAPGWSAAAVLGTARTVGSVLVVDPAWAIDGPPPAAAARSSPARDAAPPAGNAVPGPASDVAAAVLPLAGPGLLATALGVDLRTVRAALDPFTGEVAGAGGSPVTADVGMATAGGPVWRVTAQLSPAADRRAARTAP